MGTMIKLPAFGLTRYLPCRILTARNPRGLGVHTRNFEFSMKIVDEVWNGGMSLAVVLAIVTVGGGITTWVLVNIRRKRRADHAAFLSRLNLVETHVDYPPVEFAPENSHSELPQSAPARRTFLRALTHGTAFAFIGWVATRGNVSDWNRQLSNTVKRKLETDLKVGGRREKANPQHSDAIHTDNDHNDGTRHTDADEGHTDQTVGPLHTDGVQGHQDNEGHYDTPHDDHC
jgi:hypothetical protein